MAFIPEKRLNILPEAYKNDMIRLFGEIEQLLA
jgi:hypothetical protein